MIVNDGYMYGPQMRRGIFPPKKTNIGCKGGKLWELWTYLSGTFDVLCMSRYKTWLLLRLRLCVVLVCRHLVQICVTLVNWVLYFEKRSRLCLKVEVKDWSEMGG
jgi:hypothetical protein